jgi:CPA2 family monovalent cation:H+ antiporter-2
MLDTARRLNPKIETVVRTHSDSDAELLRRERVGGVFMGEHELARGMIDYVLNHVDETRMPHAS